MKVLHTLLTALAIVNGVLCYNIYTQKEAFHKNIEEKDKKQEHVERAWEESLLFSGNLYCNTDIRIADKENNEISLKTFLAHRPKTLVLRISESFCTTCLDVELPKLQKFAGFIGKNKIVIITNAANLTEINQLLTLKKIDLPIYGIRESKKIFTNVDEHNAFFFPLLFTTDSTGIARSFFIMSSSDHILSDGYYNALSNAFIQEKH